MIALDHLPRCYYEKGESLFLKGSIVFEPGISVIIGCNGSGKTTLIQELEWKYRQDDDTFFLRYSNRFDGQSHSLSHYIETGDVLMVANSYSSSEGEEVIGNFGYQIIQPLGAFVNARTNEKNDIDNQPFHKRSFVERALKAKQVLVLMDGCDSGLSPDVVEDLRDSLEFIIADIHHKLPELPLYIIASSNSLELAKDARCINARTLSEVKISSYEDWIHFIRKSREAKNRRIKSGEIRRKMEKEKETKNSESKKNGYRTKVSFDRHD